MNCASENHNTRHLRRPHHPRLLWLLALSILLGACTTFTTTPTATPPPLPTPIAETVSIVQPFARPAPLAGGNGAAYFILTNGRATAVRLMNASTPAAASVEIHESRLDENNVMRMTHLPEGVTVPAQEVIAFQPGSYHLMLIDLAAPLAAGQTIELTLNLEDETGSVETITLAVPVEDRGTTGDPESDDHTH